MGKFAELKQKIGSKVNETGRKAKSKARRGAWKRFKKYFRLYIEFRVFRSITKRAWRKLKNLGRKEKEE